MRSLSLAWQGLKAIIRLRRMVFFLGAVNLALALALAVPLLHQLRDSLGSSQAARRMASGFDYLWWEEFRDSGSGLADTFTPDIIGRGAVLTNIEGLLTLEFLQWPAAVLALLVLYLLVRTFLAGGVVSGLSRPPGPFRLAVFFGDAGRYFFRFLGLTLISSALFFGLGIPLLGLMEKTLERNEADAVSEVGPFWLNLGLRACFLLFFLVIQTLFDYARVAAIVEDRGGLPAALGRAVRFVLRHPLSVAGLAGLFLAASTLVTAGYVLVKEAIPSSLPAGTPMSFLWQQAFLLALIALRGAAYAAEVGLYRFHGDFRQPQ